MIATVRYQRGAYRDRIEVEVNENDDDKTIIKKARKKMFGDVFCEPREEWRVISKEASNG